MKVQLELEPCEFYGLLYAVREQRDQCRHAPEGSDDNIMEAILHDAMVKLLAQKPTVDAALDAMVTQ